MTRKRVRDNPTSTVRKEINKNLKLKNQRMYAGGLVQTHAGPMVVASVSEPLWSLLSWFFGSYSPGILNPSDFYNTSSSCSAEFPDLCLMFACGSLHVFHQLQEETSLMTGIGTYLCVQQNILRNYIMTFLLVLGVLLLYLYFGLVWFLWVLPILFSSTLYPRAIQVSLDTDHPGRH